MPSAVFIASYASQIANRFRLAVIAVAFSAAVAIAGCSGNTTPAPLPAAPPASVPVVAAVPRAERAPPDDRPEAKAEVAALPVYDQVSPRGRSKLSGDTEPPGKSATFAIVKDRKLAGSAWAIDRSTANQGADRFFARPVTGSADSSRFVIIPDDVDATANTAAIADLSSLPKGFTAVAAAGVGPDKLPRRIRCDQDGALMALVPAGGSLQGKNGAAPNAAPEHGVFLDAFYMDVFEITYEQYEKYREASRTAKRPVAEPGRKPEDRREPVTGVTWGEARAYAVWAGRDLPTEAEWEKAARGPDGFEFPWGNGSYVWHRPRVPGQRDRVGSFTGDMSPFGIYDLAGNAREWCNDPYLDKYYAQLVRESGSAPRNPTGPRSSGGANERVVKGGDPQWRVWVRDGIALVERPADVGFRCVVRLKAPEKAPEKVPEKKR